MASRGEAAWPFAVPGVLRRHVARFDADPSCSRSRRDGIVPYSMLEGWFGRGSQFQDASKQGVSSDAERQQHHQNGLSGGDSDKRDGLTAKAETSTTSNEGDSAEDSAEEWVEHEETEDERIARLRVEGWRDELFRTSPMLRFMARHLALVSCDPFAPSPESDQTEQGSGHRLVIRACPPNLAGGFSPAESRQQSGVLICANRMGSKSHLEDTLAHEMIHWWDHCRFKVDWSDLRQHACSEVRAASLSGDCRFGREVLQRGQWGFTKQHQACVRRRAVLSLKGRPDIAGRGEEAERIVDEVFDKCFSDTRPFDEIY